MCRSVPIHLKLAGHVRENRVRENRVRENPTHGSVGGEAVSTRLLYADPSGIHASNCVPAQYFGVGRRNAHTIWFFACHENRLSYTRSRLASLHVRLRRVRKETEAYQHRQDVTDPRMGQASRKAPQLQLAFLPLLFGGRVKGFPLLSVPPDRSPLRLCHVPVPTTGRASGCAFCLRGPNQRPHVATIASL